METVKRPKFKLLYDGKDITSDVARSVLSVTYTDKTEGESDELQVVVQDTDGLWRGEWYPDKGSKLTLDFGYEENLVPAGEFEIDEVQAQGVPDTLTIKATATLISQQLRTKRSFAHENKTLKQVVEATAQRSGLTVEGEIDQVRFDRLTQDRETDLEFLKRLADEYGYLFSVRGTKLVFTSIFKIEEQDAIKTISRRDLVSYSVKDKTSFTYQTAEAAYRNPGTKKVVRSQQTNVTEFNEDLSTNQVNVRSRVENQQQAQIKTKVALYRANSKQQEGDMTLIGDPELVAGNNFELIHMGKMSGKYHITESSHRFERDSGYQTTLRVKRVGVVPDSMRVPPPAPPATAGYEVEDL